MRGRLSCWMLFAGACAGQGSPNDTDAGGADDTIDAHDTDVADTDRTDTDLADADTDAAGDTDSGALVDTDAVDTDSAVVMDTDAADTDSGVLVDTDIADTDVVDTDSGLVVDTNVVDTDPPLVDLDMDGYPSRLDCDDNDPMTNPGAVQRCDGVDHTCGVSPIDPDGTAAVLHASGEWSDLTDLFASGTSSAPTVYATATGDTVRLCGGTWALAVSLTDGSSLVGVNQPTIAHSASRSGIRAGEGTVVSGVDLDLSATDVATLEATGLSTFRGGAIHGANWAVFVTGAGALTLEDAQIHDTTGPAISVWPGLGASVIVTASTITHVGGAAVQTYGETAATLKDVSIVDAAKGLAASAGTLSLTGVTMDMVDQPFDGGGTVTATLDDVHVDSSNTASAWYAGELTVTGSSFTKGRGWVLSPPDPLTSIRFDTCTFDGMDAGLSYGGGLYVTGSNVSVTDSTFTNNTGGFGGAIFAFSKIVLTGSTFTGNHAQSGGAVYLAESTVGPAEVTDCTFKDNSANWGGAVYTEAASTFPRDSFVGNMAHAGGGGVYMSYSGADPSTITDSTFESNTAETGGGACMTHLTTSGNTWRGNTATNGGAIYAYTQRDKLNLRGDAFYANAAAQFGGAIGWGPTLSGQALIFGTGADANLPNEGASAGTNVKLVDGDVSCSFSTCVP